VRERVVQWLADLLLALRDFVLIATGAWLLVFELWDGWPEGQLTDINAIIVGLILIVTGSIAAGAAAGQARSRGSSAY
jgi:hypothetical protein